jgi:hypothetical protein
MALTAGVGMGGFVNYAVLLLFTSIAEMFGKPLTRQEAYIVWFFSSIVLGGVSISAFGDAIFTQMVYNSFFATTMLRAYDVPRWFAPPIEIVEERSFFNPAWVTPTLILVTLLLCVKIADLSLSLFCREIFIKRERLPFPLAQVGYQACMTLAEKDPEKVKVFTISAVIAFFYAIVAYGTPLLTHSLFQVAFSPISIPWYDLNEYLEPVLPGSSFGFSTDPATFAMAFILPFNVVVSMFLGSFALYFLGNHIMLRYNLFPGWMPGMRVADAFTRSVLYIWAPLIIGVSIGAAIIPLFGRPRIFLEAFKSLIKIRSGLTESGEIPAWTYLPIFLLSSGIYVAILVMLAPDFPWWLMIILFILFPFVLSLYNGRAMGETGYSMGIPYVKEGVTLACGYHGLNFWIIPSYMASGSFTWSLKVADMMSMKMSSFIKAVLVSFILTIITNLIFMQFFLQLAPIPSSVFPMTQIFWPMTASFQMLWINRVIPSMNPILMIGGFLLATVTYFISRIVPISVIGLAAGTYTPLPTAFTSLIGGLLGNFVLKRVLGEDWWQKYRAVIVAGVGGGLGVAVGLASGLALVLRSMWSLPF